MPMFRMTVEGQFSAAHTIRGYPGPCCQLHGHNYRIEVHLAGEELDQLGMLIDYTVVKRALAQVLSPYDHAFLNDLPEFAIVNPTSEGLARQIYFGLKEALFTDEDITRRVRLTEVTVYETEKQGVGYGEV
ncbi:MAG: 6-carboxytetrahydropterin synthase QueD [Armatimonadota bacterium]